MISSGKLSNPDNGYDYYYIDEDMTIPDSEYIFVFFYKICCKFEKNA